MKSGQPGEFGLGVTRELQPAANVDENVFNHGRLKSISEYALQGVNAYPNMSRYRYAFRMSKTPDEKRETLRQFIASNEMKIAEWAREAGVDKNSIYNFLNNHSKSLSLTTYAKLARAAKVQIWRLNGDPPETPSPTSVWVAGVVQAGNFVDAIEWDESEWYSVDVPLPERFRAKARALEVRGDSMNLEYRDGSIVIWVELHDFRDPKTGDHVIAYARKKDDGIEATVKEYRVDDDGRHWLWPRSDRPEFQTPICMESLPDDIASVEIRGVVIGDYRQRVL